MSLSPNHLASDKIIIMEHRSRNEKKQFWSKIAESKWQHNKKAVWTTVEAESDPNNLQTAKLVRNGTPKVISGHCLHLFFFIS